jgi:signal transduction histidine kinase
METVLNVDDNAANRYLKSRALRQAGFHVLEAASGAEAMALTTERRPDLVLLDIKLPDMSGFEVCRRLKENPRTGGIPVVHISATFTDEQTKVTSGQTGADVYLAEPVGPTELTTTLRTVLRLSAAERQVAESHERMRLATEGAGLATWDLAVAGGTSQWSAQFYTMLGCDPARMPPSLESWVACVREDEREVVRAALSEALSRPGSLSLEHWVRAGGDGAERCIAALGTMEVAPDGTLRRLIGVAMDITERKRAEAEREALLAQARAGQQAAEEAARMKDEFLAILSHELRTPMSAVLGWLHLARNGDLPPDEHAKALAVAERNARLQSQIINDLLDMSRIVTGKLEREDGWADLGEVLADVVESARLPARARGVRIQAEIPAGRWMVQGNPARMEQIFNNLLSNAIKFSPEGGTIELRLERAGERARIAVRDYGEGMAADVLPRVFDTFRQVDGSIRRRHGGLGLGLAIVKSLVELHDGSVSAQSAGPGKGARFVVELPLGSVDAAREAPGAEPQGDLRGLQGVRVLVVDDEPDHLEMTKNVLALGGAVVATASGVAEALAVARSSPPQVIVLDIAMPGTDGYELLELLRQVLDAGRPVPAIALTGLTSPGEARRAESAGFQAHLAKPYDVAELQRTVARLARERG